MIALVAKRLSEAMLLFLAMSALIFFLGSKVPGDITLQLTGEDGASAEVQQAFRERLGLDDPLPVRYLHWLGGAVRGDFGESLISGRAIAPDVFRQAALTLELAALATLVSLLVGIPVGVIAAARSGSSLDVGLRGSMLLFLSIPTFVVGILLVLAGSRYAPALYTSIYSPPSAGIGKNLRSLLLPTLTVSLPISAMIAQMTRTTMVESLREQPIVTARAKGVGERRVRYVHALRLALAPVVTLVGVLFGSLVGGLVVTEQIFNLPGLGTGIVTAIGRRDFPYVIPASLVVAGVYVVVNLLVDLAYPLLDPRQRR